MVNVKRVSRGLAASLLVTALCDAGVAGDGELGREAAAALRFFVQGELHSLEALRRIRPPRVYDERRVSVLLDLPTEGELTPTAQERRKLKRIEPILALHDRAGAIEVKLIDVFQAAVGLHGRAVTLISRPALNLLAPAEVQALAAHEIGHDYFWDEYEEAAARDQIPVLRELELRCDGIALMSLRALRLDGQSLAEAVRKLSGFNSRFGTPSNVDRYVSEGERLRFQKAFAAYLQSGHVEAPKK